MPFMTEKPQQWDLRSIAMACGGLCAGLIIAVSIVSTIVEIGYRFQWPDPHRSEFEAYNPNLDRTRQEPSTVLALGDSFTAGASSWPSFLQSTLGKGRRVVNSGVGGTTITHAQLIARRRLKRWTPRVVVFQTYIGNDLLDLRHPREAQGVGVVRRIYWWVIDSGAFAPWYLNHRAAALASRRSFDPGRAAAAINAPFSVEQYSPRERRLSHVDPRHVERQILVEGTAMEAAWERYRRALDHLAERCRHNGADLVILVVPHCIQAAPVYRDRFAALGAQWSDVDRLISSPTPFVTRVRQALPSARVIDPLEAMQQAERDGLRLYSTNDPHLTPEGSALLGHVVFQAINID